MTGSEKIVLVFASAFIIGLAIANIASVHPYSAVLMAFSCGLLIGIGLREI